MLHVNTPTNYLEFELCFTDVFHLLCGEIDCNDPSFYTPKVGESGDEGSVHHLLYLTFCRFFPMSVYPEGDYEPDYMCLKKKYDAFPKYYTSCLMSYIDILNKYDVEPLAYTTYSWKYVQ